MTSRFLEDSVEIDLTRRVVTLPKHCHWYVMSCHVMSCHVMSHSLLFHLTRYPILHHPIVSSFLSSFLLSYHLLYFKIFSLLLSLLPHLFSHFFSSLLISPLLYSPLFFFSFLPFLFYRYPSDFSSRRYGSAHTPTQYTAQNAGFTVNGTMTSSSGIKPDCYI